MIEAFRRTPFGVGLRLIDRAGVVFLIRADRQSLTATVRGGDGFCPRCGIFVCICVFTGWFTAAPTQVDSYSRCPNITIR